MQIEKLDLALDDLDGLLEAHRALGDSDRSDALRLAPDGVAALRRELAEAMDSYAATLVASAGGELTAKRLDKCRRDAQSRMKGAVARQDQLAALVNRGRLPDAAAREDLRQLVTLSLHGRAAVATLAPAVDSRAANALANKILVKLRQATLTYLATARDSGDGDPGKARAAVVALLEKAQRHADQLLALAPESDEPDRPLGVVLSRDVDAMLRVTAQTWKGG